MLRKAVIIAVFALAIGVGEAGFGPSSSRADLPADYQILAESFALIDELGLAGQTVLAVTNIETRRRVRHSAEGDAVTFSVTVPARDIGAYKVTFRCTPPRGSHVADRVPDPTPGGPGGCAGRPPR